MATSPRGGSCHNHHAMLATHRTDYLRSPQLSHILLEAKMSANCSRHPNPDGQPANRLAFPATYRTCHKKCKYGEHFFRHVLLTPSAHDHPVTKQSPRTSPPHYVSVMPVAERESNSHASHSIRPYRNDSVGRRSLSRKLPPSLQRNNRNDSVGIIRARRAVSVLLNPPPWFPPSGHPLSEAPPFKSGNPPRGETHPGGNSTALFCF